MKTLSVALLGHRFMGRAHSNAWRQVVPFFEPEIQPRLKVVCGRDRADLESFADRWGWEEVETDWERVVERSDVDIVDISLPQNLHHEVAMRAIEKGKHVFCEKPLALTSAQAEEMVEAANRAGVVHYLNHNYRRCPAVALARQYLDEGKLGDIYHWRGSYQQAWLVDPQFPLNWKLKKETAHAGPQWDLGSHSVDLAHHLVGDIEEVSCMLGQFVAERPLAEDPSTLGKVTVEDAGLMSVRFANGALGSFENTRYATGRRNRHTFEIYGSRGALSWDLEDMNRLQYFSQDDADTERGFRNILATERDHPFGGKWWPPGHIIGYEHTFVHAVADFLKAVDEGGQISPDFSDGLKILRVLEAGMESAASGRTVRVQS